MPLDPRKLKPSDLVKLLNSTPLGEVITDRQLRRHREAAGFRLGDDKSIDLFRYVGWLIEQRHQPAAAAASGDGYAAIKERARQRNAELSREGRDIAPLPEVVNPDRRAAAERSFRLFCETYFPNVFRLAWSADHLKVIAKIEQAVLEGGLVAMAMPRGSGKSTLAEIACVWAMLYGHRLFTCLIGSDEGHAKDMLASIKTELESNDLLLEDFPEVCYPVHCLEGIANRCAGQLYQGQRTQITWTEREIVLPTIEGSVASAAIIRVAGLTGRIRGMKHKRADGEAVRPSLVILDDPQTDQSARSPAQCQKREKILAGAVLGLAGPGKKIAGIMPCTVVCPGDMADNILDRDKHPEWQGERTKLVYAFPTDEQLWSQYAEVRSDSFKNGGNGSEATEFYAAHREAMDAGSVVAWPQRHNPDELSAIQHAMNLRLADEAAFFAEYQNDPLPLVPSDVDELTADALAARVNGRARGLVPLAATHLTCFIDVQQKLLYWLVAAWSEDFTGFVVDYGAWPDQQRSYFTLTDARNTLAKRAPGAGLEGSIFTGLKDLTAELLGREWKREGGGGAHIGKCLIDANWGPSTDTVYEFCRSSPHGGLLLPSHGKYFGAASQPIDQYKRRPGDQVGSHWMIPNQRGKRALRHVLIDTNHWKSFVHARLSATVGDRGALTLFGAPKQDHRMLIDQWLSEYGVQTEGRGRKLIEWKQRPDRPDNHLWDCLVGSAVAASMLGCALVTGGTAAAPAIARPPMKLSELQRQRRHG